MSLLGSPAESPQPSANGQSTDAERQEWSFRGVGGLVVVLLLWFAYRNQNDGVALLFLTPFIVGAIIATLRVPAVSGAIGSIETWLRAGSARAAAKQGKFARFFQRPFFSTCLGIWRWTAAISDAHLRSGVRITALIFICAIAGVLLVTAAYVIVAIVMLMIALVILGWILSLMDSSRSSGSITRVTRYTTDWFGRPKQEHFDASGNKVGESKRETDWLGKEKMVHKDVQGNVVGESKPDTDWVGRPKTVHTDAQGNVIGESKPDTDWLGQPKTVHTDAEGNVTGECREETDLFGTRKTVRYDK